jgi:hypothetical protein
MNVFQSQVGPPLVLKVRLCIRLTYPPFVLRDHSGQAPIASVNTPLER